MSDKDKNNINKDLEHKKKKKEVKKEKEELSLEEQVWAMEKRADEYLDGWKRCQADFENYKKMTSESQKDTVKYATKGLILQIIPVLDNFNASIEHVPVDQKDSPWVTGMTYIHKQLEGVLSEYGVEELGVKEGDNFDPKLHEAIEDKECKKCKGESKYKNKISRVVQKGYKMQDKIIRPARVIVE